MTVREAEVAVIGLGPAGIVAARALRRAGRAVAAIQAVPSEAGRSPLVSPAPTGRPDARAVARPAAPQAGLDGPGGAKRLAAPQAYRLEPWTLRARTLALRRYGEAAIPRDADLVDWPIGMDELAPYYERIERLMGVGPRPPAPWTDRMAGAARARGWAPFAAPAAASPDATPLLAGLGVRRIAGVATGILRDSAGEVSGVDYLAPDGTAQTLRCRAVILAGSVIPTIRLLLRSGIAGGGPGAGPGGGTVGRWFMSHNAFTVHGWFPDVDLDRRSAGPATAVAISEFEGDRFDHAGLGFLGGSVLQAAMTGPWDAARMRSAAAGLAAPGGLPAEEWVRRHHRSIGTVWAQPDQLPRRGNAVDLDPEHRDASGRAVPRITFALAADDAARWAFLSARMAEWLEAAGAAVTWRAGLVPQPLGTHLYGGARMGRDPASSVVDPFGRVHGVPGLVVVGSSTFPSTGGRGPVETVEALAWRSADQLAEDLG